jgi:HAD superfamily hydrolase (TIGR01549 family)
MYYSPKNLYNNKNMLEIYKNILWDFDGVIMDSNPIRDLGFEQIFSSFDKEKVAALMDYHRKNGGLSRFHKIRYFFEHILQQETNDDEVQLYADRFSAIMRDLLCNRALLISDTVEYIRKNKDRKNSHLVSASAEDELKFVCSQLGIDGYFRSIHGSPATKIENVRQLLVQKSYQVKDTCLIGDSVNDAQAAGENGITFFGYNSQRLRQMPGIAYIESFREA